MLKFEKQSEQRTENREYLVKDGLQESVSKILDLLKKQTSVIISIVGNNVNTGKTFISSQIGKILIEKGINVKWCGDASLLSREEEFPKSREVLILHAESPFTPDSFIESKAKMFGLPHSKIDLRIFVYTPNRPFDEVEKKFANILIRNEDALKK